MKYDIDDYVKNNIRPYKISIADIPTQEADSDLIPRMDSKTRHEIFVHNRLIKAELDREMLEFKGYLKNSK